MSASCIKNNNKTPSNLLKTKQNKKQCICSHIHIYLYLYSSLIIIYMLIVIVIGVVISTVAGIQCPIPDIAMATLTPTSPVSFEALLTVTCPDGYVIDGTNETSSNYPCLASRSFNVSHDMCVGEFFCLCVCVCAEYAVVIFLSNTLPQPNK